MPLYLPMFHLYGLGIILFTMLSQGCKLITFPKYGIEALIKFCERYKPNLIHTVPPIGKILPTKKNNSTQLIFITVLSMIDNPNIQPKHLETVRTIISAAAPLGASDVERFHKKTTNKIDLIQFYGLTETSPIVTM